MATMKKDFADVEHDGVIIGRVFQIKGEKFIGEHNDGHTTTAVNEPRIAGEDVIHYHVFLRD